MAATALRARVSYRRGSAGTSMAAVEERCAGLRPRLPPKGTYLCGSQEGDRVRGRARTRRRASLPLLTQVSLPVLTSPVARRRDILPVYGEIERTYGRRTRTTAGYLATIDDAAVRTIVHARHARFPRGELVS